MAKLPDIEGMVSRAVSTIHAETEALIALPGAVASLTQAVRGLAETVARMNAMLVRVDGIVTELEEPLKALAPGMQRLAVVLDDPMVDEIPETLKQVQADILPVLRTLADTHERVAVIAGSTERLMSFVDDTSRTLAGLPGAALLGRRRAMASKVIDPLSTDPADPPDPPDAPAGPS